MESQKSMRLKKADEPKKPKLPVGTQARHLIEAQTAAFLSGGGQVTRIGNGISGYTPDAKPRSISAEKSPATKA